jgi:hypothetical protein
VRSRTHHLHEDELFDAYLAERGGAPADPPSAEHLAECGRCAGRYAELVEVHETLRAEAEAEADAIFTPERLQAQQQQIARRLETVGRAARILSFPSQFVRGRVSASTPRVATRWIAAAAAAGLFVGVAAGMFLDNTHESTPTVGQLASVHRLESAPRPARLGPSAAARATAGPENDDAFLNELDSALDRPYTRELAPFDALTPHVREVTNQIR